jgi:hypothetical protein
VKPLRPSYEVLIEALEVALYEMQQPREDKDRVERLQAICRAARAP